MKKLLLTTALALLITPALFAQTKVIEAQYDGDGLAIPDVIINEMVADTSATGEQLNSVYMLEAGENYTITQPIVLNNPVTLTAPDFDRTDPNARPPVVRVGVNADGSQACPAACVWFLAGADLTLSNIYFGGIHLGNGWTNGNLLNPIAPDINVTFKNLIIDYMGWSIIANFDAGVSNVSYFIQDTYIKNAQNPGDPNSPFLMLNIGPPIDTLLVQNTTYFQSHGFFIQSRTPINYFRMDHVTLANALKSPIWNLQLTDAEITNNVFYNTVAAGFNPAEIADQDPDGFDWNIVNADTLLGNAPSDPDSVVARMAEADRRIVVRNNVWYQTPDVIEYMADSLRHVSAFMNPRAQAMFDDDATWPGLVEENNLNLEFSFANLTEPGTDGLEATAELLNYMINFRTGAGVDFWGYESDLDQFAAFAPLAIDWPRTEDLRHNITSVTDDNGNPIGDQNWFPEILPVSTEGTHTVPERFSLEQNYPNPFNPATTIQFNLSQSTNVTLEVFNLLGQKVATLLNDQPFVAGTHQQRFDASHLASGIYIYRISSPGFMQTKKMLLVK